MADDEEIKYPEERPEDFGLEDEEIVDEVDDDELEEELEEELAE